MEGNENWRGKRKKIKTCHMGSRNKVLMTCDIDLILITSIKFLFKVICKLILTEKKINLSLYMECQFKYALTFKLFYKIMKPKLLETFTYRQTNIHCSTHNPNKRKCW